MPWAADEDGVIFITGGTGGLGVVSAEALAEAGARKIVLTSRSGTISNAQGLQDRVDKIRATGVQVIIENLPDVIHYFYY